MATAALGALMLAAVPAIAQDQTAPASQSAAKPEIGTFGFDLTGMDKSVQPGDDFYAYANGTWAKNTEIPADKSNYGMRSEEHTSELQSLMRNSYAVFCLKKKKKQHKNNKYTHPIRNNNTTQSKANNRN